MSHRSGDLLKINIQCSISKSVDVTLGMNAERGIN